MNHSRLIIITDKTYKILKTDQIFHHTHTRSMGKIQCHQILAHQWNWKQSMIPSGVLLHDPPPFLEEQCAQSKRRTTGV